jgi:hypothetical protein
LLNLSIRELKEVGYILIHMSRNEGLNAIIENYHMEYWALVNSIILDSKDIKRWIKRHNPLFSVIGTNLLNQLKPQYKDQNNKRFQNSLFNKLYYHDFFPAVWAGFAYLEGLCRRICNEFVDTSGTVKKEFIVCGKKYGIGGRISNLYHILSLTHNKIREDTRKILDKFFIDYNPKQIFAWRNDSLHGTEDKSTALIVLYCLISILLLDLIEFSEDY